MTDLSTQDSETEVIEKVRGIFRAYIPESDAWKSPSFFDVNAIVVGGIAFSAMNEARGGIDARVNPATAVGPFLDAVAATPPLSLTRRNPTPATGFVSVSCPDLSVIPAGYTFETADGVSYVANSNVDLAGGEGLVEVVSTLTGAEQNSPQNQPFVMPLGCSAVSQGIYGGNDRECDAQLRRRIFAARADYIPLGSPCWYESAVPAAIDGVTRTWFTRDGGMAKIIFLMEDKYPCGTPQQSDIDELKSYFNDECRIGLCFCPVFCAAKSGVIAPEICWSVDPDDICEVQEVMQEWLRANYDLGDAINTSEIQCFLNDYFPQYGGKIKCAKSYPAECDLVYNCVELIGGC